MGQLKKYVRNERQERSPRRRGMIENNIEVPLMMEAPISQGKKGGEVEFGAEVVKVRFTNTSTPSQEDSRAEDPRRRPKSVM